MMQNILGDGAQNDASYLTVASRADHERVRSSTESSKRRPRRIEDYFALDHDRRIEFTGHAEGVRDDGIGRIMDQTRRKDGDPFSGHVGIRTHHMKRRIPFGRLRHGELDGTVRAS